MTARSGRRRRWAKRPVVPPASGRWSGGACWLMRSIGRRCRTFAAAMESRDSMDIQTYCERCGDTFAARYDATRHLLILECRRCDYTHQGLGLSGFQALSESQRQTLVKLVERTALAEGVPVPTITLVEQETKKAPPPVVYPAVKIPPLKLVQPTPDAPLGLLVQPLLPPEAFRAHA